ncbi:probable polyol transporter 4 [Cucurbita pepo subsp. pepo]|uniref:probable polyol transporter 4 n=1 Tax=Cucurbita pepo subsp. pepo TaxID=3664 RepID=UPI000C9D7E48|nr:probable polyol transporter 4 [Cucurbita pepo subsp. pepo]
MQSTVSLQPQGDARQLFLPLLDSSPETTAAAAVVDGGRGGGGGGGGSFPKLVESSPSPPNGVAERESRHINKYVLAGAVLASTNSILLGYDIGVMSGAILFLRLSGNA